MKTIRISGKEVMGLVDFPGNEKVNFKPGDIIQATHRRDGVGYLVSLEVKTIRDIV